jgi:hypothetical protein
MVEQDLSCCVKEFFMPCDQQRLTEELDKMMEHMGKSDMLLISGILASRTRD